MSVRARLSLFATALLFVSCAGSPPRERSKPARTPPAVSSAAEVEQNPDTSPVPEPSSLVAVGRITPAAMPVIGAFEPSFSDIAQHPIHAMAPWLSEGLDENAAADAPFELAVAIDSPETLMARGPDLAMSVGVSSLKTMLLGLRQAAESGTTVLERRAPGVWSVRRPDSNDECSLLASVGGTEARLVCATSPAALETLGAYMARGLPSRALGKEPAMFEAWPARFAKKHGDALSRALRYAMPFAVRRDADLARLEPALATLLDDGLELLSDTEHLHFSLTEAPGAWELSGTLEITGNRSWFSRTIASYASRPSTANALFRRFPADTELGFFSSGPAPERSEEARQALSKWLSGFFGPGVQKNTLDAMTHAFLQKAPYAYAEGDAYGSDTQVRYSGKHIWEKTLATFGWHLIAIDEPLKDLLPELDNGMKAYDSGDLHDLAYRELRALCPGLAKITKRAAVAKGLPRGSMIYEMKLPGKFFDDCVKRTGWPVLESAPNEALVVLAVPDGQRSFVGFGPKPDEMMRRMAELSKNSPTGTLASVPELEPLAQKDVTIGGFVSLAGMGDLARFLSMQEPYEWRRSRLSALPNHGKIKIPFELGVSATTPLKALAKVRLTKAALEDLRLRNQVTTLGAPY